MTREGALVVTIAVVLVLFGALAWAWMRRRRRDGGLRAPFGEPPAGAHARDVFPSLYVATTRHDEPLERLAIAGLAFRSRADVTVTDGGVVLDLAGQPRMYLPAGRIAAVAQSTVAIDRVVEKDGLVRLTWRLDDGALADTYLRPQDSSARALADSIGALTTTGTDA
ncbi:hypothetical protein AB1K54_06705 [Microbacterium sp. BWT-B31]|uniref:PH-like domain-containing protein n=1 Tax=Microbacterium sp. BWT-B31 TaxID=3232072 RepID=UPI0035271E1F